MFTSRLARQYVASMLVYGTYRGFRANYDNEFNKNPPAGTRLMFSCVNGLVYGMTPYGFVKLIHMIDRLDIYISKKEAEYVNSACYHECLGFAKNMNVL